MLYIILQIVAFQALFLLVYDLFLKRETFFNYNRTYLIITSLFSLVLPFLKFSTLKTMATKDVVIHLPEVFIGTKAPSNYEIQIVEQAGIIIEHPQTPMWQIIVGVGIAIATLIFLYKMTKLYWLKHKNPKRWKGNVLIIKLIKSTAAFSFFNMIFLGERISDTEKSTIFEHELVHIKEFHTLDLLFFELLRILLWFNPLVYIYQNRIKELHEYIADAKAVKQSGKAEYYTSLLNQVLDVNHVSFTNTFFKKSLIKKRIAMLQKSKSKQLHLIKYALLIPLIFGMLIYTSTEVRAQQKVKQQEKSVGQELTDAALIEKYYKEIIELHKDEDKNHYKIQDDYNYTSKKYIPTKDEYLRYVAYSKYMGEKFKKYAEKSDKLTKEQKEQISTKFKMTKSFDEYLAYLKTDEAKKGLIEANYNRTLQVISNDIDNLTEEEHKDAYEKVVDVLNGRLYRKLQIRDQDETVEITKNNYDNIVRFFSTDEIKTLLNYVKDNDEEVEIENIEVPFNVIDKVASLPECQDLKTNTERKNCMNQVVNKFIGKNFNIKIADSLSPGRKRIFVSFKIDTKGNVKDIKARGPSKILEKEAKRVIGMLPQFIPGKQRGKLVTMPYSIPIVFEVNGDNNNAQVTKSYKELVAQRDRLLKNSNERNPVVINLNKQIDALKAKQKALNNLNGEEARTFFNEVEIAPIYPDCKGISDDAKQRKCTIAALNKFVGNNFNIKLADSLSLPSGKNRIFTRFVIDKQGNITNITARGPHPKLEEEAIRVLKLLPQFTPGKQDGKAVEVPFSLPIVFQIEDAKKD